MRTAPTSSWCACVLVHGGGGARLEGTALQPRAEDTGVGLVARGRGSRAELHVCVVGDVAFPGYASGLVVAGGAQLAADHTEVSHSSLGCVHATGAGSEALLLSCSLHCTAGGACVWQEAGGVVRQGGCDVGRAEGPTDAA